MLADLERARHPASSLSRLRCRGRDRCERSESRPGLHAARRPLRRGWECRKSLHTPGFGCDRARGRGGQNIFEQINNSSGEVLYLHHDQQGSTRLLTGSTGKVEGSFTYGPYGETTGHTGTATTPLGYDAQYTSSDTGLIYLRNRVYDPKTAQFLTVDPAVAFTGEPYSYASDNPLNESDPTGLGDWLGLGIPSPGEVGEEAGEAIAGWGDTITFGGTEWVREQLGDNNIDSCSGAYQGGGIAGLVTGALIPGEDDAEAAEIAGFTSHGLAQVIGREGVGVSDQALLDAVRDPENVIEQANGTTRYVGKDATVVLNGEKQVVTAWPNSSAGWRTQP
jgi:RHS repeat-associated protein